MKKKSFKRESKSERILLLVLIITIAIVGILRPAQFFTVNNFRSMVSQMPEFGILSLAMMTIILSGGINLSVAMIGSLSGIIAAFVLSSEFTQNNIALGIILAFLVSIGSALVMGALNGFLVSYIGVAALLVTLGTSKLFEGIGLNLTKGGAVSGFPAEFMKVGNGNFLGIPIPMWIYVALIIISYLLLERTVRGKHLFMSGSNMLATEFSGVDVKWTLFKSYLFSAFLSAMAGMIMISRYNSAKIDYGSSYLMQTVTAVVLGGTSIAGGEGSVAGTVIAVAIIQVIGTGLNIIGVNRNIVDISIGAILIAVLAIKQISRMVNEKKLIEQKKVK
jgi:simple sugar transport system permease protein